jgi:hypothetical protein
MIEARYAVEPWTNAMPPTSVQALRCNEPAIVGDSDTANLLANGPRHLSTFSKSWR